MTACCTDTLGMPVPCRHHNVPMTDLTPEDAPNELSVLRDALEASDAWDFSEVDDGLDADILGHMHGAGYAIVRSDELAGLRALSEAATPGPWRLREYRNGGGRWSDDATDRILIADLYGTDPDDSSANRDFIVAAVNWVRSALEGVSR